MMESESQRSRIAKTSHSTGNEGWTSPHTKFNFWMSGVEAKKNTNFQRKIIAVKTIGFSRKSFNRVLPKPLMERFEKSPEKTFSIWNPNENKLLLFKHFLYLYCIITTLFLQNFLLHILWPLSQFSSFSTDFLSWFTVSKLSYLLFWLEKDKQNARCCNNLLYAGITRIILQTRNI